MNFHQELDQCIKEAYDFLPNIAMYASNCPVWRLKTLSKFSIYVFQSYGTEPNLTEVIFDIENLTVYKNGTWYHVSEAQQEEILTAIRAEMEEVRAYVVEEKKRQQEKVVTRIPDILKRNLTS